MSNEYDGTGSHMPALEVIDKIREATPAQSVTSARITPPPTRLTINRDPSNGKAPLGGAVLSAEEVHAYAHQRGQTAPAQGLRNEIGALESRLALIVQSMDRHSFDPRTGAKVYAIDGQQRSNLENERSSLLESLGVAARALPIAEQREAQERDKQQQRQAEEAVIEAATHGDRELGALVTAELKRIRAGHIANWIAERELARL